MTDLALTPVPAPAAAAAAVQELNLRYIEAVRANDVGWFGHNLAEDVVMVFGSGRRVRKSQFLALLRNEPKTFRSLTVHDVTLRVFGSVVQVDADAPWELADGQTGISRYIDTYAWMDGRWQVISAQVTWLPQDDASA